MLMFLFSILLVVSFSRDHVFEKKMFYIAISTIANDSGKKMRTQTHRRPQCENCIWP